MYDSITVVPPAVPGLEGLVIGGTGGQVELEGDPIIPDSSSSESNDDLPDDSVVDESEDEDE
jgi:hypothetical protein